MARHARFLHGLRQVRRLERLIFKGIAVERTRHVHAAAAKLRELRGGFFYRAVNPAPIRIHCNKAVQRPGGCNQAAGRLYCRINR